MVNPSSKPSGNSVDILILVPSRNTHVEHISPSRTLQTSNKPKKDSFSTDGATAHTADHLMRVLRQMFPNKVISRFGDIQWPPRWPDLSSCDYFLWGFLKEGVYAHKPRTLEDLKLAITEDINGIEQDLLTEVSDDFQTRMNICREVYGHHMRRHFRKMTVW